MTFTRRARTPLRLAVAAAAVSAVAALAGCANNDMAGMPGMDQESSDVLSGTSASVTPAAGPHNQADVMFAQMMIPHHQQAIQMSDMLLAKDDINPDVIALAEQIKAAQAPEIAQMNGWLAGWGQTASPSMPMDHDMGGGMMKQEDMDALDKASGDQAAKLFLQGMITPPPGAIEMAKTQLADGQNADAKQLAQQIVDSQQAEITTMQQLLADL